MIKMGTQKACNSGRTKTSKKFAEQVSGMQFEYGDVVKVFHAEPDRLKWYQNNSLAGQGKAKVEKNYSSR